LYERCRYRKIVEEIIVMVLERKVGKYINVIINWERGMGCGRRGGC
jgi:hypothetical protein